MPERYELRVVEIEVGAATPEGARKAWAVEEWTYCNCPNCDEEAHWQERYDWHETKEKAQAHAD